LLYTFRDIIRIKSLLYDMPFSGLPTALLVLLVGLCLLVFFPFVDEVVFMAGNGCSLLVSVKLCLLR
jgi:lipid-A-disaccharide synthase-like uncharacterized protein